jgi:hypothetical protein
MALNIEREVAAMRRMTTGTLRAKYSEVFGEQARSRSNAYLIKRIAWRMQVNVDSPRSERARQRATKLADNANLIMTAPWRFLSTCFAEDRKCPTIRCAIYTRTARGTEQHHGQRELAEGYVANNGWHCLPDHYDDCGYGGANLDRPALQRLLQDIQDSKIDCVVICDLARLSRSSEDLQSIMDTFERQGVSLGLAELATVGHGVPRVAKLLALAIRFDQLVSDGVVANYAELTRLGRVSRARVTQIANLLNLAPDIQEEILFLPPAEPGRAVLTEKQIRRVAAELDWRKQRRMWHAFG